MMLWAKTHFNEMKANVKFNMSPEIHHLHVWSFAYREARIGNWSQIALDRHRFELRIKQSATFISPILSPTHREKIFRIRFQTID